MDLNDQLKSARREVLCALDEALSWLERPSGENPDVQDAQLRGMFHLGKAGGLTFFYRLPGIESEALFDEISAAAAEADLDQLGRIRRSVGAEPGSDHPAVEPSPAGRGLDWEAGPLQMLAVLNEARTAREEGDATRYALMAGFLVGLMAEMAQWGIRYRHGTLADAVQAAHDRNAERATAWVQAESIKGPERKGELAGTDQQSLLLRWLGERLAAAHRLSSPLFFHSVNETGDERRDREAAERAYYYREETSIQRAQNFGTRRAGRDGEGISVPMSYSLNRALVLDSHKEDDPPDGDNET